MVPMKLCQAIFMRPKPPREFAIMLPDFFSSVVGSIEKLDPLTQFSIGVSSVLLLRQIPKVGRAVMLAVQSRYLRRGPEFPSMRTGDKSALLSKLKWLARQQFIVCKGPRGIGKTHMIRDALTRTPGVVYVNIAAGTKYVDIMNEVYGAIANVNVRSVFADPKLDARRVRWWYRVLFRRSPIVVLEVMDRAKGHSDIGAASMHIVARELSEAGFLPIVDTCENISTHQRNLREVTMHLAPLPFESYHDDPEFKAMFKLLGALGIRDAHLRVLDGKQTSLINIWSTFSRLIGAPRAQAINSFDISRLNTEPKLREQMRLAVLTLLQREIHSTFTAWCDVPEHLRQAAADTFKNNRSAMEGVRAGASPSLTLDKFYALSECKAFQFLSNGKLAPTSPALLLLMRRGDCFEPKTFDDFIIEELEPKLPVKPANVQL